MLAETIANVMPVDEIAGREEGFLDRAGREARNRVGTSKTQAIAGAKGRIIIG